MAPPDLNHVWMKLETEFMPDTKSVEHISWVSETFPVRRRVKKVERWQKKGRIGKGGFGVVNLEECVKGDRVGALRAVKKMDKNPNLDYKAELEAMAIFSNDRVKQCFVQLAGWYENPQYVFIAMEYLPQGDLQKYLETALPEAECKQIVWQLLEGIDFLHKRKYTHRDLKPANILVASPGPRWWVKIADFGISKCSLDEETIGLRTSVGTPMYIAPEVVTAHYDGTKYTRAVDMWSLGAITFFMLTHEHRPEDYEMRGRLFGDQIQLRFPSKPQISAEGVSFVRSLLAIDPAKRPKAEECLNGPWLKEQLKVLDESEGGMDRDVLPPNNAASSAPVVGTLSTTNSDSTDTSATPTVYGAWTPNKTATNRASRSVAPQRQVSNRTVRQPAPNSILPTETLPDRNAKTSSMAIRTARPSNNAAVDTVGNRKPPITTLLDLFVAFNEIYSTLSKKYPLVKWWDMPPNQFLNLLNEVELATRNLVPRLAINGVTEHVVAITSRFEDTVARIKDDLITNYDYYVGWAPKDRKRYKGGQVQGSIHYFVNRMFLSWLRNEDEAGYGHLTQLKILLPHHFDMKDHFSETPFYCWIPSELLGRYPNQVKHIQFSPNNRLLALAGQSHFEVHVLSNGQLADSTRAAMVIAPGGVINTMSFSRCSKLIAVASNTKLIHLYFLDSADVPRKAAAHTCASEATVLSFCYAANEDSAPMRLVAGGASGYLAVIGISQPASLESKIVLIYESRRSNRFLNAISMKGQSSDIVTLEVSEDGLLAYSQSNRTVRVVKVETLVGTGNLAQRSRHLCAESMLTYSRLVFLESGELLLVMAGIDRTDSQNFRSDIELYDPATLRQLVSPYNLGQITIRDIAIEDSSIVLLTEFGTRLHNDGLIMTRSSEWLHFPDLMQDLEAMAISPNGLIIAGVRKDGGIIVWTSLKYLRQTWNDTS